MEKKKAKEAAGGMNRRDFLATAATGIAGFMILPSFTVDGVRIAPSDRVVLGFVGLGQQGCSDFNSFTGCPGVQVAACCDVDSIKRERFRRYVTGWQKSKGMPQRCDMYEQYEQLLERKDIDIIYTGDGFCIAARSAAPDALREGNTIVVSGRDLHEGKLME